MGLAGCRGGTGDLALPDADQVEAAYTSEWALDTDMNGNVAEVTVYQPADQLRRGGTLWAKVGPYIFLFSDPTRQLFTDFGGLAAVRVIIREPSGTEVARATLERQELNAITWKRALNIAGRARRDGSERPSLLEDLVEWGEDHTDFEYNERFFR